MCFRPPTVEAGPVKCPKCGAEVDPTLNECPSCGAKAAPVPGVPGALAHRVFQGLLVYRKLLEFLVLRKLLVLPALRKRRARSIRLFVNLLVSCGEYKTPALVLAGVLL